MGLEIITNNAPRFLVDWLELTDAERRELDWIDPAGPGEFFRYRGNVYSVAEFMRAGDGSPFPDWDGYAGDSYFSGVLIRYAPDARDGIDPDRIICARYFS